MSQKTIEFCICIQLILHVLHSFLCSLHRAVKTLVLKIALKLFACHPTAQICETIKLKLNMNTSLSHATLTLYHSSTSPIVCTLGFRTCIFFLLLLPKLKGVEELLVIFVSLLETVHYASHWMQSQITSHINTSSLYQ